MTSYQNIQKIQQGRFFGPPVILQALDNLEPNDATSYALSLSRAIVESGGISFIASRPGPLLYDFIRSGTHHIDMSLTGCYQISLRSQGRQLMRVAEKYGVHLIHSHTTSAAWSSYYAARGSGAFLLTGIGSDGLLKKNLWNKKYFLGLLKGHKVTAVSDFVKQNMCQYYGKKADRIEVVPYGVNTKLFHPSQVSPERIVKISRLWRLTGEEKVLALTGSWNNQRDLFFFLRGLHDVMSKKNNPDLRCVVLNSHLIDSGVRKRLELLAKKLNLMGVIHFIDKCDDISAAYMLIDVVVCLGSHHDPFGRFSLEAQSMGRPVICPDWGSAKETIVEGKTGWLFPYGNIEAFSDRIHQILSLSSSDRANFSHAAIEHISQNYATEKIQNRMIDLYERVLMGS